MRIVDVCAFYSPNGGGVKTYVEHKLRAGPLQGHDIVILVPGSEPRTEHYGPGARIEYIVGRRFPLDGRYHYFHDEFALHAMLDALKPDWVEASTPWSSASMVANWRGTAPRSLIMHADPLGNYAYRWFRNIASRQTIDRGFDWFWRRLKRFDGAFDHIICASDDLSTRLRFGGLKNVVINRMGVQPNIFSPRRRSRDLRRTMLECLDLPDDALLLFGGGRHAPEKRWPMIIDAVTAAGYHRPVGLIIAGEGRARRQVERAVGNNPHIRLIPPITDRREFAAILASADALVHGSESETFCMIAAEAQASGIPMLLPDCGAAADHLIEGAGLHFEAANAASLARAIGQFIDLGRARQAVVARDAAPRTRTMDAHFQDLFTLYHARQTVKVESRPRESLPYCTVAGALA
ncbi:glycosyltransferase [Tardiphaga sp.]|uniref:glycosyltransferase n=1 Tax=Tardiphaga sp. TaxID=1926292 RepID=UPI00352A6E63